MELRRSVFDEFLFRKLSSESENLTTIYAKYKTSVLDEI